MAVTGHTVMSDAACRASALGAASESLANKGGGGRAQSVAVQGIVFLAPGSYIELWAANNTSAGATLTAIDLNFNINRVN